MPLYQPMTTAGPLPPEKSTFETETLDLKGDYKDDFAFHLAKDVAAFANRFGGTILVGAKEDRRRGCVGIYKLSHPLI